jgi:isoquinoline 1-oxidoreductase alpha subunit
MKIIVNGELKEVTADATTPLLWVLRDHLDLTGTKYSCGIGLCGACTVLIDGEAVRSCRLALGEVKESAVLTIEGLSDDLSHPVQRAWREERVAQCGYCQGGQMLSTAALLERNPDPSDEDIDNALALNYCRCGTQQRIRKAVHRAAGELRRG